MNLNVAHIIIKIRERVKYYFVDFVLHKNINIMFIVKSSWSYLNKKILPHLCECLDNASFDFRGIAVDFVDSVRQPHFLFIFVTFLAVQDSSISDIVGLSVGLSVGAN